MYTVKRAIIMAAGKGRRMGVLTQGTPKPMLKVRGERMICRMIRFLLDNGIEEIYIVVGWQKERFQEVLNEFPQVRLIENPYYDTCNNISSIYAARELLEDCMILEGDQYFFSPAPLARDFAHTEYNAYWQDTPTVEWLAEADENGKIIGCSDRTEKSSAAPIRAAKRAGSFTACRAGRPRTDGGSDGISSAALKNSMSATAIGTACPSISTRRATRSTCEK